eukprot:7214-Eustigmatos_ZCMA.PRE.1
MQVEAGAASELHDPSCARVSALGSAISMIHFVHNRAWVTYRADGTGGFCSSARYGQHTLVVADQAIHEVFIAEQ